MSHPRRRTRVETVAAHLIQRGHISEGSALVEYGRFRLADVIHRLRNDRSDLIPEGMEIVTIHKQDTKGDNYGEYTLVPTKAATVRRIVDEARARAQASAHLSKYDDSGFHRSATA
jgi:hypothetical protein